MFATKTVVSGLIPGQVKPKTIKNNAQNISARSALKKTQRRASTMCVLDWYIGRLQLYSQTERYLILPLLAKIP